MIGRILRGLVVKKQQETGVDIHLTDVASIASSSNSYTSMFASVVLKLHEQNDHIYEEKQARVNLIGMLQKEHAELEGIEIHNNKVIEKIEDIIL